MSHDLSNYEEVPDRIIKFFEKHPEGSLRCQRVEYRDLPAAHLNGEPCPHIIYHALAYRSPDDKRPGMGKASEPLPGLTPYTKGSELMNAETSAWGRALAALGFVGKKIATAEEVKARQSEHPVAGRTRNGKPSDASLKFLRDILSGNAKGPLREKKPSLEQLKIMLSRLGSPVDPSKKGWTEELSRDHCSELLTWFKERPLPSVEYPSDVPSDGFEPPSQQELEAARLEFEEAK